jgi:hypothetical protein
MMCDVPLTETLNGSRFLYSVISMAHRRRIVCPFRSFGHALDVIPFSVDFGSTLSIKIHQLDAL